jgi:predicted CXXCH cytochrome family protein
MTTPRTDRAPLALAALVLLLPLSVRAAAGLANSKHNLAADSGNEVRAVSELNSCAFCHTPHGAQSTRLLWNHTQTEQQAYNYGTDEDGLPVTATAFGTPLPTTVRPATRRCLGCHDGSISVGDVSAGTDIDIQPSASVASGKMLTMVVGADGDLSGEHPVGIPYAAEVGYNGANSAAAVNDVVKGDFFSVRRAGCTTPTGICTSANPDINLIPNQDGTTTNVGIECTTCHEPHNRFGFDKLLRVSEEFSALCKSCHNK